ncbi:MAG TPA: protein kinase [Pyrinomonadaceae bacterium]|nr:protein kinase [Pyrinomonadaceae bacterium]
MKSLDHYVGQVLDDKYRLEKLLGRGGMGAVYLATHLGTERYVALKLITPQLMRNEEFVQRFKREARAAGRLRHPNVVDVTDFGFARADGEPVAYLVMEYLDGCTLADVLREEKRLSLDWVADILEQVCSAVHEAHQQGIVHRDLKPENIWLEPNRLGSYRVKVLDFGIAKLAESGVQQEQVPTMDSRALSPVTASDLESDTLLYSENPAQAPKDARLQKEAETQASELGTQRVAAPTTLAQSPAIDSVPTQRFSRSKSSGNDGQTLRLNQSTLRPDLSQEPTVSDLTASTTQLTHAGAIMGTPVYMSPEQCAAKPLDARSDIYSLGVIAYQMLAGEPPFVGDTASVMREQIDTQPPPLRERAGKVPERVAKVIMSALEKDPARRPQTAVAFANSLRAQAEGIGSLYRRAFALYSEYFPKFLRLSLIAHTPVILLTMVLIALELVENAQPPGTTFTRVVIIVALVITALLQVVAYFVAASAISGITAVIVTQLSVAPLRPVKLQTAFAVLKRRWRAFLRTAIRVTLRIVFGFVLLVVPGIIASIRYALYAPVVLIEGLEKKAAMRRARELASRSWRTVIIVSMLQFLIPMAVSLLIGRLSIVVGEKPAKTSVTHQIYQQLSGLINIVVVPLMSIVPALLYLRMRQLGGEILSSSLAQLEEVDDQRSDWQQRMRTRLAAVGDRNSRSESRT